MYALSLIDRFYLYHSRSPSVAGLYSIAVKLAGAVAFIVRAFQYAWPPLAYSVTDDAEAARLYGLVTTYYVLISGWVVAGLALGGRWVVRLLTAPSFYDAYKALPWVALGWAHVRAVGGVPGDRRAAPRSPRATSRPRSRGWRPTWCCCSCWSRRWESPAPASPCAARTWRCWA